MRRAATMVLTVLIVSNSVPVQAGIKSFAIPKAPAPIFTPGTTTTPIVIPVPQTPATIPANGPSFSTIAIPGLSSITLPATPSAIPPMPAGTATLFPKLCITPSGSCPLPAIAGAESGVACWCATASGTAVGTSQ